MYRAFQLRLFFLLLLLAVVLHISGCGSTASPKEQSANEQTESQSLLTRTYKDAYSDVEIPASPQKIAVLLDYFSDPLLTLGIKPYAATTSLVNDQFLPYIAKEMEGVIPIGSSESLNMERLLESEPDLIIAFGPSHEKVADQLRKIAPTIFISSELQGDWRQMLLEFGKIVGKEELAQQELKKYLDKVEAAKIELDKRAGNEVFVVMRVMPKELRVYGVDDTRIGRIIHQELDLQGVKLEGNKPMMPISFEELPALNPDHIFLMENVEKEAKNKLAEMKSSAVWKGLSAVQKNQVYIVEQQLWNRGVTPIGANHIIDQVLEFVK
ncbi:ABC transporter substrate-binding protein [Brevibacillus porteri]|uniref:ABC transporter substrate-binding protein n=1 Tax=Brevibacillus porteri TaxID=2126350 RepID=UPI00035C267F|nr:hypothetical protein A616_08720 [Brevibacillus brevis X23]